jgi:hypothetical protein
LEAAAVREEYLSEVTKALRERLTPLKTFEQIDELRQHLSAMADAYEEIGCTREAAMQNAVRKFGDASTIAKGLVQGTAKPAEFKIFGDPLTPGKAVASMRALLLLIGVGTLIGVGVLLAMNVVTGRTTITGVGLVAIGSAYASCIAAAICWSFPRQRPWMTGAIATGFALVLAVVAVTRGGMNPDWGFIAILSAAIFGHGTAMALISKRLRAGVESTHLRSIDLER